MDSPTQFANSSSPTSMSRDPREGIVSSTNQVSQEAKPSAVSPQRDDDQSRMDRANQGGNDEQERVHKRRKALKKARSARDIIDHIRQERAERRQDNTQAPRTGGPAQAPSTGGPAGATAGIMSRVG
jgi:hypothetical protein